MNQRDESTATAQDGAEMETVVAHTETPTGLSDTPPTFDLKLYNRPYDMTGDIEEMAATYQNVAAMIAQIKEGQLGLGDIEAAIQNSGFHEDWRMFIRLRAKKELALPLSSSENGFLFDAEGILERAIQKKHNERIREVSNKTRPIIETLRWAQLYAPEEYKTIKKHQTAFTDAHRRGKSMLGKYKKIDEQVDFLSQAFINGLSHLPSDALVFTQWMSGKAAPLPPRTLERFRLEKRMIAAYADGAPIPPAPLNPPDQTPAPPAPTGAERTAVAEGPKPPDQANVPPYPEPTPNAVRTPPEVVEARAAMERYGVEEGLRQVAETHPEWAEQIARWAERRWAERHPAAPIPPPLLERRPAPPPYNDDNEDIPPRP